MSDLLRLALKAQLPIVKIVSDDPNHLEDLLSNLSKRPVAELGRMSPMPAKWKEKTVYYGFGDYLPKETDYNDLLEREISLVVVNAAEGEWSQARDCGRLVPSIDYIKSQLSGFLPKKEVEKFARYFAGMSMSDVVETIMLTQARDGGKLTPTGINETKSYLGAGMAGLEALETVQANYVPPTWANEWLSIEAPLLDNDKYRKLWPKGFMLYGPTGTGKTELAVFISKALGWPLYRLDLGSLYSRWQGESESNLRRVLSFISAQGECVFLLDEAEKLFGSKADGQASLSTLLSMLLWWMNGETNRTVTVMTSNDLSIIPPELYRPGRLDAVHEMRGLNKAAAQMFVAQLAVPLATEFSLDLDDLRDTVQLSTSDPADTEYSQASLVARLRASAKKLVASGE